MENEIQVRQEAAQKAGMEFLWMLYTMHINAQAEIAALREKNKELKCPPQDPASRT